MRSTKSEARRARLLRTAFRSSPIPAHLYALSCLNAWPTVAPLHIISIIVLDGYHLGDPLFGRQLGRDLAAHAGPVILVHDSGEDGERALEGQGVTVERARGRLVVRTEAERSLVERSVRELNRRLADGLNEEGVPVIRVTGTDRGLLRSTDGEIQANAGWLATAADGGAVPLVGALVAGAAGVDEVDAASAAAAIAGALLAAGRDATLLFLLTDRRTGLQGAERRIPVEDLPRDTAVGDIDGLRRVCDVVPCRLTTSAALRGEGLPAGTDVGAGANPGGG